MGIVTKGSWNAKGMYCNDCDNRAVIVDFMTIDNCPYCGSTDIFVSESDVSVELKEDVKCQKEPETAQELADEIKDEYHNNCNEDKMEKMLDKLVELAKGRKSR